MKSFSGTVIATGQLVRRYVLLYWLAATLLCATAKAEATTPIASDPSDSLLVDSSAEPSESKSYKPERWYGWQTLLIDSAALGAGALAFATGEDAGMAPSLPAYTLGAPIVHLLHERPGAALVSGGARLILPIGLGLALGDRPSCGNESACFSDGFMVGATLGMLSSVALDAALLSWQPAENNPPSYMVPAVLVGNGTYGIALSGSL